MEQLGQRSPATAGDATTTTPTTPTTPTTSLTNLAAAQLAVVAAVTGTGDAPVGFDPTHLEVARKALLRKRSSEIATRWPMLAAGLGADFLPRFAQWARQRPTQGSLRDGADFAEFLAANNDLPAMARLELAQHLACWRSASDGTLRRRRMPLLRRVNGLRVFGFAGWCRQLF